MLKTSSSDKELHDLEEWIESNEIMDENKTDGTKLDDNANLTKNEDEVEVEKGELESLENEINAIKVKSDKIEGELDDLAQLEEVNSPRSKSRASNISIGCFSKLRNKSPSKYSTHSDRDLCFAELTTLVDKAIKELNKETARYCSLVVSLGASHDSITLREELKKSRRKAHELAKSNKSKLLPHLRKAMKNKHLKEDEISDIEKLWNTFSTCVEVLNNQLHQTLRLQKHFILGSSVLINTGVQDIWGGKKSQCSSSSDTIASNSNRSPQHSDLELLENDILEIKEMLLEMHQQVDVKPWAIECDVNTDRYADSKSLNSVDSDIEGESGTDPEARSRLCTIL
ncbi:unnamed protein product [Owenia fusiformis]|uniref:Uncharacterized protein n=1 Tax=Owenia fusiformis TaxID=6347 RepID=A0A8J1TVY2_OWEFU|nr:unnamed protein product [Owenia fusiformis]